MKIIEDYIKDIKKLFFISIDKDINRWRKNEDNTYEFQYGKYSSDKLFIDLKRGELYIGNSFDTDKIMISEYKNIIILDKQVYKYVKKLKKHFKECEKNELNKNKINILSHGLNQMIEIYKTDFDKRTRKDKLENL